MIYIIKRLAEKVRVEVIDGNQHYPLVHVGTHGSEFEYGFYGAGPADLAWSILANHFRESNLTIEEQRSGGFLSTRLHQQFKEICIAKLDQAVNEHRVAGDSVAAFVKSQLSNTFDMEVYRAKRDAFREASRLADQFEDRYASWASLPDDLLAEWRVLSKTISSYWDWFDIIVTRA